MPIKYYGYPGKAPESSPNQNMELLLQNLMTEAQLEQERAHSMPEPPVSEEDLPEAEQAAAPTPSFPPSIPQPGLSQPPADTGPSSAEMRAALRTFPTRLNTSQGPAPKRWVDRNA